MAEPAHPDTPSGRHGPSDGATPPSDTMDAQRPATPTRKWDPVEELGLINHDVKGMLTCMGKTMAGERCKRGPAANDTVRCFLGNNLEIQGYVQRLANLPRWEAAQNVGLLLELAKAMMCAQKPGQNQPWKGHQAEQAAFRAASWRTQLAERADPMTTPQSSPQPPVATTRSSPPAPITPQSLPQPADKRYRGHRDESPSPSERKKARIDNGGPDSVTTSMSSTVGLENYPSASKSPSDRKFDGLTYAKPERLAAGIRTYELRFQVQNIKLSDTLLELGQVWQRALKAEAELEKMRASCRCEDGLPRASKDL